MTYCIADETPDTWHKTEFQSRFLSEIGTYMNENELSAKLSGAITYNGSLEQMHQAIMGPDFTPCMTTISFEHKEEHDDFVEWYKIFEEKGSTDEPAIIIADESTWSK